MNSLEQLRQRCAQPLSHPDLPALREHAEQTLDQLLAHHASLPRQRIGQSASRQEMAALLAEPPPEQPSDFATVLEKFWRLVAPHACQIDHPRFLAFIPSAPTWFSVLGHLLCAGTNFFAGVWAEAAGPAQVELVVLDWVRQFLGMPSSTEGILTSGGSEANLTALVVARDSLPFRDRSRALLYVSDQRHWSIDRAARILGFHPEQIHVVPTWDDLRLQPAPLLSRIRQDQQAGLLPWVVVANAGATNTGVIDPLDALTELCRAEKLWLHVDAAYGWAAVLGSQVPVELRGIAGADSVTFDPHKWLAQTFDVGGVLIREGERLRHAFCLRPEYMQDVEPGEDEVNFADRGLALTRRFRALEVWLSLKVLGVGWYRRLIDHGQNLAGYAEPCLQQAGFEIVVPPRLSVICFRLHPPGWSEERLDELNLALIEAVRRTGQAFLSSTRLRGRVAIRFCFINWRTCADDVDQVVTLLRDLGGELVSGRGPEQSTSPRG